MGELLVSGRVDFVLCIFLRFPAKLGSFSHDLQSFCFTLDESTAW